MVLQLPMRLVVAAIYIFLAFVALTWWVVMPTMAAFILSIGGLVLIFHIINTFSAIGRVIMFTGAMADVPIIPEEEEEKMNPHQLSDALITRARMAKHMGVDVMKQYRFDYQELIRDVELGKVQYPITDSEMDIRTSRMMTMRRTQVPSRAILRTSINGHEENEPMLRRGGSRLPLPSRSLFKTPTINEAEEEQSTHSH